MILSSTNIKRVLSLSLARFSLEIFSSFHIFYFSIHSLRTLKLSETRHGGGQIQKMS